MPTEDFQWFLKMFKNCRKIILRTFQHFLIFSEEFWRFLKTSNNFWRLKKNKMLESHFKHIGTISKFVQRFSKTSEDFQWFPKISRNSENAGRSFLIFSKDFSLKVSKDFEDFWRFSKIWKLVAMFVFVLSGDFSQVFQRISKQSTEETWTVTCTSGN